MKDKIIYVSILVSQLCIGCTQSTVETVNQKQTQAKPDSISGISTVVYVLKNEESLKDRPEGAEIARLPKFSELTLLDEKGQWVKVRVEGWMLKSSLTTDSTKILRPESDVQDKVTSAIDSSRVMISLVRADSVLLPFALYDAGKWSNPWPKPSQFIDLKIASLADIPKSWLGTDAALPINWYFCASNKEREPILLNISKPIIFYSHCEASWGF